MFSFFTNEFMQILTVIPALLLPGIQSHQSVHSSLSCCRLSLCQNTTSSTSLRRSPEVIPRPLSSELLWRLAVMPILTCRTLTSYE